MPDTPNDDNINNAHYPTQFSPCIKIIEKRNVSDSLRRECSEFKKKKVKRKKYPLENEDEITENFDKIDIISPSSSNFECDHNNDFLQSVQSMKTPPVKSDVNCSLRHEWSGVTGCRGNNNYWYEWDDEIFIKPESDAHLSTPEVDNSIPLHILPYVEID